MTALLMSRADDRAKLIRWAQNAPADAVARIGKATRSDKQNRWLWPHLQDLQRQVPEMATSSLDDLKLRFLNALGTEMRFLPVLEGEGMFPAGLSSSALTKMQFAGLQELILKFGAERDVTWSEPDSSQYMKG